MTDGTNTAQTLFCVTMWHELLKTHETQTHDNK
jgi:hypothetical protein